MIKKSFQKLLIKSGKTYKIDPNIPDRLFFFFLFERFLMVLRGLFCFRKKIYLGRGCVIKNKSNFKFGSHVTIEKNTTIDCYALRGVNIGNGSKLGAYSLVTCTSHLSKYGIGLKIGDYSAFGRFSEFGASGGIEIGNNVIGGAYISFHSENHNYNDSSKLIREQGVTSKGISIGNNVWIGAKVTFLDGCKIGNNSVIAAGAVVNGQFPDNVVIGGVPAKVIKTLD
jgi:acetyltransferase-like isoleucine patch superfamily enzyme